MHRFGFVKVGACVPELKVADVKFNTEEIKKQIEGAIEKNVGVLVFPELCLTGYTCADLFQQEVLLQKCEEAIEDLLAFSKNKNIVFIAGTPIFCDNALFNSVIVIQNGKILGIIPKTYIPNYNEFYEKRWFASSEHLVSKEIHLFHQNIPIGLDLLFTCENRKGFTFGVEICEDVWSINPKSNDLSIGGANVIFNLSASNETIGKYEYRKNLIKMQSAKTMTGYVYVSAGVNESTTDLLFSGSSMIYENGTLLSENERFDFKSNLIYNDIDVSKLNNDRIKNTSFQLDKSKDYRKIGFQVEENPILDRTYTKTPFVPSNPLKRKERCEEIIHIQSCALAKRLKHTNIKKCILGISGGLDSTLAFLIIVEAYKKLGIANENIMAITMPGFGTTNRTYKNAVALVKKYGATLKEVDIKKSCIQHFKDIEHDIENHNITYENGQARERTQILMDIANQENGLVIGTGDLSELALGWCTYNGDQMSMYAVNTSIPKTLVKYLVEFLAENESPAKEILLDILDTPISPELLPPSKEDKIKQITEDNVGPYVLHDFYLYHFLRYGASPKKIVTLAYRTFQDDFTKEEILKWLKVFLKRFFTQQFKRSCMPDGVKVGSISLSPRGDMRMPSDASYTMWLEELESEE